MPDPIVSTDDLSDYIGRDVSAENGALIAVDAASDMVRDYTGQDVNEGTSIDLYDGTGTDALLLAQRPVNTVGTVLVGGTTYGTALSSDQYAVRDDGCLIRTAGAASDPYAEDYIPVRWPAGRQNVEVTYSHGWGTADVPRSLRMVALQIAARIVIQGVALFETRGQDSVRYAVDATSLSDGEKSILRLYKTPRT